MTNQALIKRIALFSKLAAYGSRADFLESLAAPNVQPDQINDIITAIVNGAQSLFAKQPPQAGIGPSREQQLLSFLKHTTLNARNASDIANVLKELEKELISAGSPLSLNLAPAFHQVENLLREYRSNPLGDIPAPEPVAPGPTMTVPETKITGGNPLLLKVQSKLKAMGIDPGPIDGIMGPRTQTGFDTFKAKFPQFKNLSGKALFGVILAYGGAQ